MKLATTLLSLIYASCAVSASLNLFGGSQQTLDDEKFPVPGKNPLVVGPI